MHINWLTLKYSLRSRRFFKNVKYLRIEIPDKQRHCQLSLNSYKYKIITNHTFIDALAVPQNEPGVHFKKKHTKRNS